MINKKGFEMAFGWIFAIMVGAAIIFLAIYFATSLVSQTRNTQDTLAGQQLGIILNPIETTLESAQTTHITFPVMTRVYNSCDSSGTFGTQGISISTKSAIGDAWQNPGVPSIYYNKYLFSASTIEATNTEVLVQPFDFPYKVADLTYMWNSADNYCFVEAPNDVEDELGSLSINDINFTTDSSYCPNGSITVCFASSGCDIDVSLNSQSVTKDEQTVYYGGDTNALLYGAIFSDPAIYTCQLQRLMERDSELASLYEQKSMELDSKGCTSGLESDLGAFSNLTLSLNNSIQIRQLSSDSDDIERSNSALSCKLF